MCRFVAYLGHPIITDELLFKPRNSLIKQSFHAQESEEPLNGDGFGLGWYVHDIDPEPAVFTSIQPAWNDRNLAEMSPKIRSHCFFAHVRAANAGVVSQSNCHPFHHKELLFMHNGLIQGFSVIKRHLRRLLSDDIYDWIKGQTDSEHFFALFLETFRSNNGKNNPQDIATALQATIDKVEALKAEHGIEETSVLNVVISDGNHLIATRYSSQPDKESRSLHYAVGNAFKYDDGKCKITNDGNKNAAVLIVSEKLTSYDAEWVDVPMNHMVMVGANLSVTLQVIM